MANSGRSISHDSFRKSDVEGQITFFQTKKWKGPHFFKRKSAVLFYKTNQKKPAVSAGPLIEQRVLSNLLRYAATRGRSRSYDHVFRFVFEKVIVMLADIRIVHTSVVFIDDRYVVSLFIKL